MKIKRLLIANRGEIAIRIARAASDLGIETIAIYAEDDQNSLHTRIADSALPLEGSGAAAYLNIQQIIKLALENQCQAIHPGYGFLSENAQFVQACTEAGLVFVGPRAETLELFGNKAQARQLALECGIPVPKGTDKTVTVDEALAFFRSLAPGSSMMIKALVGGGGRGMRLVSEEKDIADAYDRCVSEAQAAFGSGELYVEEFIPHARHIEVQILGDGNAGIIHLYERECSIQRRNQKVIEIAPAPGLSEELRHKLTGSAIILAKKVNYLSLGTFEFLVNIQNESFFFIEANPRLQVEHTVTEEITGIDLVQSQLAVASGDTLKDLKLDQPLEAVSSYAIQLRINAEKIDSTGKAVSSGGTLSRFDLPTGPGIRIDTCGYQGYTINTRYDSLLAKLVVHSRSPQFDDAVKKAYRALCECQISGIPSNISFLQALLKHPEFEKNTTTTSFVQDNIASLAAVMEQHHKESYFSDMSQPAAMTHESDQDAPENSVAITAPMQGVIVEISADPGETITRGQQIAVIESMKMEHVVHADISGEVCLVAKNTGQVVNEGQALVYVYESDSDTSAISEEKEIDLSVIPQNLQDLIDRQKFTLDEHRPDAVARRRKTGQRTARENIADLVDPDSFIEYGSLAVAAQRRRHSKEELMKMSPADGLITGIASVNGSMFPDEVSRCMVVSYDYTVLAGTQGAVNHRKKDRMFELAHQWKLPVILFAEGGGGRPGDTDVPVVSGLNVPAFNLYAKLSGHVPTIGIVSGRCFAGNAALLGCSDVIIATKNANIGMGGPAMIEGGGLGVYHPSEVGPVDVQTVNGVIDILVEDETEAVSMAKKYFSYYQGPLDGWECEDQRMLRHIIPQNRLRSYDVSKIVYALADRDSVLELRKDFGTGVITAFVRIEGKPFGLMANNSRHLGGAIDSPAADKISRFLQLCDSYNMPVISLCDTPGFMVGPDAEKDAQVRHFSRIFVTAASLSVPIFFITLRKGYGLGAQAMAGGSFLVPMFTASWPAGEFGGMGIEGAVRLGFKKELEAIEDPEERQAAFKQMVDKMYSNGRAINTASILELDEVIDPFDTRKWIMRGYKSIPPRGEKEKSKHNFVDTW